MGVARSVIVTVLLFALLMRLLMTTVNWSLLLAPPLAALFMYFPFRLRRKHFAQKTLYPTETPICIYDMFPRIIRQTEVESSPGVTLSVYEAGPQDGPLVVFVHSFPETGLLGWKHQIIYFAQAGELQFCEAFLTDTGPHHHRLPRRHLRPKRVWPHSCGGSVIVSLARWG